MAFITNSNEKTLSNRIKSLIEKSTELKFLTGFFYFSGIKELYETLKKIDEEGKLGKGFLKILVGLNVDKSSYGIYEFAKESKNFNTKNVNIDNAKSEFIESLKIAFTSEELDSKEIYAQVDFFLKLLKEEKLLLRKTSEPCHAKLYLFKTNEITAPHLFITGSSNLTKAGLTYQKEFNVEIKDYGFAEAENFFNSLWEDAIEFSRSDVDRIFDTLRENTFFKQVTPWEAWAYLLKTYLELHKPEDDEWETQVKDIFEKSGYRPYTYQVEAVLQALKICKTHGGVILADVVGLGKTVIACALGKCLRKRGLVIAPPHLIGDENKTYGWKKYLEDFDLRGWEVRSLGKLEETLKFVKNHKNIEIVIVDEAHRFRNENTERYHYLHEICRGKIVILLTATPFNNRPSDIFALLKLFTIPKKSTIILDEDLKNRFDHYETLFNKLSYIKNYHASRDRKKKNRAIRYYEEIFGNGLVNLSKVQKEAQKLAREIRGILEPVVIRRNRLDLKHYEEELAVSKVKDPEEWFFELTREQSEFYDEVISTFADIDEGGKFKGAIYFPIKYEKGDLSYEDIEKLPEEEQFMFTSQKNLYDFMRRLLVKRFESSFGAFRESIERFINIHECALKFIKKTNKFILNRKLMKDIVELEDEEKILEELEKYEKELEEKRINEKYHKVYKLDEFKYYDKFLKDVESDKKLFEDILKKFDGLNLSNNDPKAKRLIEGLKGLLKERKVVIFTEYIDTAKHLEKILERDFKDKFLPAYGNLSRSTVEAIYENFDAQYEKQKDRYKILLATDKLSEGFNLNRAGAVINYDIPWNPVRVIQRVGRINRIAKKVYDEIYIINFFPTEQGADIVRSRDIAANKMFMIHKVLGEDSKIFSPDEEPEPAALYRKLTEYKEEAEESFFTKVKRNFEEIKKKDPEIEEKIKNMPLRIKVAKKGEKDELFVFIKKGNDLFIGYKDYKEKSPRVVSFDEIYEKVKVENKEEPRLPLSESFWENYDKIVKEKNFSKKHSIRKMGNSKEAFKLLKSILADKHEELKDYKKFISTLIEDIEIYGTLSEHILSQIVDWEGYFQKGDFDKIAEKLKNLKEEIGENFIERVSRYFENIKETVIIAIENQEVK